MARIELIRGLGDGHMERHTTGEKTRFIVCPKCDLGLFVNDQNSDEMEITVCNGLLGDHVVQFKENA